MRKITQNIPAGGKIVFPGCKTFVFLTCAYPVSFNFITVFNRIERTIEDFSDTFSVTAKNYFLRVEVTSETEQEITAILLDDGNIEYRPLRDEVHITNNDDSKIPIKIPDRYDSMPIRSQGVICTTQFDDFSNNPLRTSDQRFQSCFCPKTNNPNFQTYAPAMVNNDYFPSASFSTTIGILHSLEINPEIDCELIIITRIDSYNPALPSVDFLKYFHGNGLNDANCSESMYQDELWLYYKNLNSLPTSYMIIYKHTLKGNETNLIKFENQRKISNTFLQSAPYDTMTPRCLITTNLPTDFDLVINCRVFSRLTFRQYYLQGNGNTPEYY